MSDICLDVYRYVITNITPLIITSPRGYRGLSYVHVADYINGSMVRGGLITSLMNYGIIKDQNEAEKLSYNIRVTPALPCKNTESSLYKDVTFAHSLSYTFKAPMPHDEKREERRKFVYSLGILNLINLIIHRKMSVEDAISELISRLSRRLIESLKSSIEFDIRRHPAEIKNAEGMIIVKDTRGWATISTETGVYVETSVERARGSSRPGVLYAYEYIRPGTIFTGYITYLGDDKDLATILKDLAREKKEILVRIGRGTGRGYGLCKLKLEMHDIKEIEGEIKDINIIALEAISPMFTISPYPKPVTSGDKFSVNISQTESMELEILHVIGRHQLMYRGWSYLYNAPRLPILAQAPGCLFISRITKADPNTINDVLSYLPYVGLNEYSSLGFNFVYPIIEDFIPEYQVIS